MFLDRRYKLGLDWCSRSCSTPDRSAWELMPLTTPTRSRGRAWTGFPLFA